jgi:hypothetical protein
MRPARTRCCSWSGARTQTDELIEPDPVGVLALLAGEEELVEIGLAELAQPAPGLDQQPAHDLRADRDPVGFQKSA